MMEIGKLLPQNHGHKLHALRITNQGIHKIKVAKIFLKKMLRTNFKRAHFHLIGGRPLQHQLVGVKPTCDPEENI